MKGLVTVFTKELTDYLLSWRGIILFAAVLLTTVFAVFGPSGALQNIRQALDTPTQYRVGEFVFLRLFTTSGQGAPSFLYFITMFLVPILGITLGFDAINNEQNNGTLGRLLSQPIYRDVVFNGKFLAGTVTIGIMLSTITLLISGLGLRIIGVPPSSEEAFRIFLFLVLGTLYGAFWLGLAMLFSVLLRRVATSALASIAVWVFFIFFMTMITGFIANTIAPVDAASSQQEVMRNLRIHVSAMRASPIGLFQEATTVLLVPGARTMGEYLQLQTASGALWMPGALPLGQTILTIWPHIVTLIATTAVLFVISYAKFMREEIRST